MSDLGLAQVNVSADLDELQARAHEAMSALEVDERPGAIQQAPTRRTRSGCPSPTTAGWPDVSIGQRWSVRLTADPLGSAVLAAYRQAEQKQSIAAPAPAAPTPRTSGPSPTPGATTRCRTSTTHVGWTEFGRR